MHMLLYAAHLNSIDACRCTSDYYITKVTSVCMIDVILYN